MPFPIERANLPRLFDAARAERTFERLAQEGFVPKGDAHALLEAAFANSPYLARLAIREHALLRDLFSHGPEQVLAGAQALVLASDARDDAPSAMSDLRIAKRRAALAIALADIAGSWDLDQVTRALTDFADAAVGAALRFALREAAHPSELAQYGDALERETGLVILAMGKYGAFELNYSSDIDLIVFYDADIFPFRKRDDPRGAAVDVVKTMVRLLSETTADGYVFRVDLRLRPDASATQIAISTAAAESYYEGMGQNWERAAMIKARACAGDPRASARFLKAIEPFVWRRSLDFAAIEDIHSIKRQIHAHGGHGPIAVEGHNIKLGRGGIREIEFFAQTQQLIAGGRNPALRPSRTVDALDALAVRGLVAPAAAEELKTAYRFLRTLEHRLQMVEDEQTHTLPKSAEGIAHIAAFMAFDDHAAFRAALTQQLEIVQGHYAQLFETAPGLANKSGNLVFTGVEDDPDTLATLAKMGFRDPHHVAQAVRGWHHGRIRATRSARARELLTKLMPLLLAALAATADPDAAFAQFDRFVSNLPGGVQLFSLLLARSELLTLIAEIVGSAPRLAQHLARAPTTLDVLLDPGFLGSLPTTAELERGLREQLALVRGYEAQLDSTRRFAKEQMFRVGVQVIEGAVKADEAGPCFARIAEAVIGGLLPVVEKELALSAGHVAGGAFAVIAMGKLGGREMTAASDLDLIFVYDAPPNADQSDGPKPLPVIVYYARLAQRLIAALTVQTAAGGLYEVDMRLRPTGNKGPVAVRLEGFARYHAGESWTWERMALTRARIIVAPDSLRGRLEGEIGKALTMPIEARKVIADARDMREKLAVQFPGTNRWDLKFAAGGLVDIEFVAQALQLVTAPHHPDVLRPNTIDAIAMLERKGALSKSDAKTLIDAAALEHALTHVLRIALDSPLDVEKATPGLRSLLVRASQAANFRALETRLADLEARVYAIRTRILGN